MSFKIPFLALIFCATFSVFCFAQSIANKQAFIKFSFNVDSALLVLDLDFANAKMIANQAVIEVNPGNHLVQLATPFDYYPARDLFIANGKTVTFYSQFSTSNKVPADKLHENPTIKPLLNKDALFVSDSNTKIYKNDVLLGTGAVIVDLQPMSNTIRFVNPNFGSKEIEVSNSTLFSVFEHYRKPQKTTAQILSTIPGLSQAYKRQYVKSLVLIGGIWFSRTQFKANKDDFNQLNSTLNSKIFSYNKATDTETSVRLGDEIDALIPSVKDAESDKNLYKTISGTLYVLSVLDGFLLNQKVDTKKNLFNLRLMYIKQL